MSHNTGCVEFLHIHERESYEVLAILKKRQKVTFTDDAVVKTKRPRLDPTVNTKEKDDAKGEIPEVQKVPRAKEIQPNLSHTNRCPLSIS